MLKFEEKLRKKVASEKKPLVLINKLRGRKKILQIFLKNKQKLC